MANQQLGLEQTTALHLTPQQLRFVRLLELNAPELEEAVKRELEENVALEESAPAEAEPAQETARDSFYYRSRQADEDTPAFAPADTEESIYDNLLAQLSEKNLSEPVEQAARYIIGSLDSNGYLDRRLENLVDDMAFNEGIEVTPKEAREALDAVRSLEPAGIAAFSLQESLEMQLEAMEETDVRDDALLIIRDAYEAFTMKHKHRIISTLKFTEKRADDALALIRSLNPRPGAALGSGPSDRAAVIIPDFIVSNEDGRLSVALNSNIPELKIDLGFEQAVTEMQLNAKKRAKKGEEYILRNYNDARDFINILAQRQKTMMAVMTAIIKIQKEYFLTQDVYKLRPMMIKNVAELTGLDFSVISRATNGKFVATPWGIFPLRFFFSDSVGENAEGADALTNRKIEQEIRALIDAEEKRHPLSDQRITEEMQARGYEISRRTVAKYRDRLRIPVARLRKEM